MNAPMIHTSYASTAHAGSICHSIGGNARNTNDANDGSGSEGTNRSIGHGVSFRGVAHET
jgi:hypothetical protein